MDGLDEDAGGGVVGGGERSNASPRQNFRLGSVSLLTGSSFGTYRTWLLGRCLKMLDRRYVGPRGTGRSDDESDLLPGHLVASAHLSTAYVHLGDENAFSVTLSFDRQHEVTRPHDRSPTEVVCSTPQRTNKKHKKSVNLDNMHASPGRVVSLRKRRADLRQTLLPVPLCPRGQESRRGRPSTLSQTVPIQRRQGKKSYAVGSGGSTFGGGGDSSNARKVAREEYLRKILQSRHPFPPHFYMLLYMDR